jgi:hypothetical protein
MRLFLSRKVASHQTEAADSFQGGHPKLPDDVAIPSCSLCHASLTFYLQVAFPTAHAWGGHSLAVFACTSCVSEGTLIPEMLTEALPDAEVSEEFLRRYATNFRTLVFETTSARLRPSYAPRIRFAPLSPCWLRRSAVLQVGGKPRWVLEDESPRRVANTEATFLFQLREDLAFDSVEGAPLQLDLGLDGSPTPGEPGRYRLFLGNEIYFFGTREPSSLIYILTQVD